jgi:hypothetical protein
MQKNYQPQILINIILNDKIKKKTKTRKKKKKKTEYKSISYSTLLSTFILNKF